MNKPTLAVVIIAKNEADRIGRLLKSLLFADEILVVDSGSTDGTQALCETLGARVLYNEWQGYAAQKQFALEQVTSEWILNLDADEEVSKSLADEIVETVKSADPDVEAFTMPRLSRYLGRWIMHGGWYPDRKVRLVRRGCGIWKGALHEKLIVDGEIKHLSTPLLHYTYRGVSAHLVTINSYSDAYASEHGARRGYYVSFGVLHCFFKFLECYVWKRGFLDGIPGLIIAMNSAWYVFIKHAKLWELSLKNDDNLAE